MARLTEREIDVIQQSRVNLEDAVTASESAKDKDAVATGLTKEQETWIAHGVGSAGLLRAVIDLFVGSISRAHQRRSAIAQLESLDDRMLADIGMVRADIRANVNGAIKRDPARPSLAQIWRSRREHQATVQALASLDDRMLSDIGLQRNGVGEFVDHHFSWQANALRSTLTNRLAA